MNTVFVPAGRFVRWVDNFGTRHGTTTLTNRDGGLHGSAEDGSWFLADLPFAQQYDGEPEAPAFAAGIRLPREWGILLVRKGGFAVARVEEDRIVDSKVGQRHVQGTTKAGGWSQQRYARRRDNQAHEAYAAAAAHADRVLAGLGGPVVLGGDAGAINETQALIKEPGLASKAGVGAFLTVPDPKRHVLEEAVADACSIAIVVLNA